MRRVAQIWRHLRQRPMAIYLAAVLCAASPISGHADVDLSKLAVPANPRLGLSFPGSNTSYYSAIAQAGIGVVRISASWERIEPQQGRFDFSGLDKRIKALQNLGISPFITFESNANWATTKNTQKVKNAEPKYPSQWEQFVGRVVERYDGDGKSDMPGLRRPVQYWQAANEWVSDSNKSGGWAGSTDGLISYVTTARNAVKSAYPNAIFVMGGIATFNMDVLLVARDNRDFQVSQTWGRNSKTVLNVSDMRGKQIAAIIDNRVLPMLGSAPFDLASVHLYGPEGRDMARIAFLRKLTGKAVLSSECGGPSLDYGGKYTDTGHFEAVIERNLNVFAAGGRFCLWFRLGEGKGTTYGNQRTGLYDTKAKPKPGVFAYRALSKLIDRQSKVSFERKDRYVIRRGDGKKITVAWGAEAVQLQSQNAEILCLANPVKGVLSSNPSQCPSDAMTFAGAGLNSIFSK